MMAGCGANCQLKALIEIVAPFTSRRSRARTAHSASGSSSRGTPSVTSVSARGTVSPGAGRDPQRRPQRLYVALEVHLEGHVSGRPDAAVVGAEQPRPGGSELAEHRTGHR